METWGAGQAAALQLHRAWVLGCGVLFNVNLESSGPELHPPAALLECQSSKSCRDFPRPHRGRARMEGSSQILCWWGSALLGSSLMGQGCLTGGLEAQLQLHVGGPCTSVPHVPIHSVALFGRHKEPWYILVPRQAQHLGHGPPLPGGESVVAGAVAGHGKWRPGRSWVWRGPQRIRPSMMVVSLPAHSPGDPFSYILHPPSQLASVPRVLDMTPLLFSRVRPPLLEPLLPRAALYPGIMQLELLVLGTI